MRTYFERGTVVKRADVWIFSSFDNKITFSQCLLSTYYVFCAGPDVARVWTGGEFPSTVMVEGSLPHKKPKGPSKCQV